MDTSMHFFSARWRRDTSDTAYPIRAAAYHSGAMATFADASLFVTASEP